MENRKHRLLAVVLCIAMSITFLPTASYAAENVCEINGTGYATLESAVAAATSGQAIMILQSVTSYEPMVLNGKEITLDLSGYTVTLDTTFSSNSTALTVSNGGKLNLAPGAGELHVKGWSCGVNVDGAGSVAEVTSAETYSWIEPNSIGVHAVNQGEIYAAANVSGVAYGALAESGGQIAVGGNVDGQVVGACAMNGSRVTVTGDVVGGTKGIYSTGQNSMIIAENVSASVATGLTYGADVENMAKALIWGICSEESQDGIAVFVNSQGEVTVEDAISPQGTYIKINGTTKDGTIMDRTEPTTKEGYHTYSTANSADGVVWVKTSVSNDACYIQGGLTYTSLSDALAAVAVGQTKTICLLKDINYNQGINLDNKKITFALNGHTLNVVSSVEGVHALNVYNGGCVFLSGEGTLNVTGPARGYGVTVASNSVLSQVTVSSATAQGVEGKAAHAYNKANLTVLGDVTATGIRSFGLHAQAGAVIEVGGNVYAGNQGVCVSDATARVTGNVTANGNDLLDNPEGIGVNVYDGVAEIGGSVNANRVGAMMRAGGSITVEGTVTAPDYIQFNDDAAITVNDYVSTTTKAGYRTYNTGTNTVWIKDGNTVTVQNGTGGGIYVKDAVVTITAGEAPEGQRFREWTTTPSVIFVDSTTKNNSIAKFTMPEQSVAAAAVYEAVPLYSVTVQNDGNGTASASLNSAAEGAEVTLTASANPGYQWKEWQVLSGGVIVVNNTFYMLGFDAVVKAIFEETPAATYTVDLVGGYPGESGEGSYTPGTIVSLNAGSRSDYTFLCWTSAKNLAFADVEGSATTFVMPAENVSVMAHWSADPPALAETVCRINETGYPTLRAAVVAATNGETITLLKDIIVYEPLFLNGKEITLDLSGYTVTLDTTLSSYSTALTVSNGGKLSLAGAGEFHVEGWTCGVKADGVGSVAEVTSVRTYSHIEPDSIAAHATNQGEIHVAGNVDGVTYGGLSESGGQIAVGGNVNGFETGVCAMSGSRVIVTGDVVGGTKGIYATGQDSMITAQNVSASAATGLTYGAYVDEKAKALILGICSEESQDGIAVFVNSQGEVTVEDAIDPRGTYAKINGETKDGTILDRTEPTTKEGYHTYSTANSADGVVWVKTGGAQTNGSTGQGGSGSQASNPPPADSITVETKPNESVEAAASIEARLENNGSASALITSGTIGDLLAKVQGEDKILGKTTNGITVGLDVAMPQGASSLTATLTGNSLNDLVRAGVGSLALRGAPVSLGLDLNALQEIQRQSGGDLSIKIAPVTDLPREAKDIIGKRPVYNISISTLKDGKEVGITGLGNGRAILSIPYTPGVGEAVGCLFGVYIDQEGNPIRINNSVYDEKVGAILFPTGHFSLYGVGYTEATEKFNDISGHWAKESIDYALSRGFFSGVSDSTFGPDIAMTRQMAWVVLARMDGESPKDMNEARSWAMTKGISDGTNPQKNVTREQMAVLLYQYAKYKNYDTKQRTVDISKFKDYNSISTYAKDAQNWTVTTKLIYGNENKLIPQGYATRAQVAAIFRRFLQNVMN
ncbi:MAG: S-layer homology domain-containing protein [Eubacteriales bacterium]|nr:S-layer homology domain-containing protein [Eubacteriales bacterium]